jgi:hypothetical protein
LQAYCNTLHEEVHVLYSQLHPSVPADPVGTEAEPSQVAGEAFGGELDLFRPPPSMKLVDEWSPTPDLCNRGCNPIVKYESVTLPF